MIQFNLVNQFRQHKQSNYAYKSFLYHIYGFTPTLYFLYKLIPNPNYPLEHPLLCLSSYTTQIFHYFARLPQTFATLIFKSLNN